jgi:hypothetical protein
MYHATMTTISAEQTRDLREQAAAWRRTQETRGAVRARPARPFALIARGARSQARQKRQQGPAPA